VRRMEMARAEVEVDPVTAALVGWLVNRVATAGQRVLARWLGGDKQAKALRPVVSKAIQAAVEEIDVPGDREAVVGVLRREGPGIPEIDISDVLALREAVLRLISPRLAGLAEQGYQVDADRLADAITQRMESGIQFDAARGGPLAPVAELLPHGQLAGAGNRVAEAAEETVRLLKEIQATDGAAFPAESAPVPRRPLRLGSRPAPLAGREELLAEVHERLAGEKPGGPGWWRCTGWAEPGRQASLLSTRTVT
jgi:hypothetical protein